MELADIGTNELVEELMNRCDAMIFSAVGLPLNGEMSECVVSRWKGCIATRLGLCRIVQVDMEDRMEGGDIEGDDE